VALAGDVEPSAGGGGHPQVAGAGVEDDGELLGGGADLNLAIVLGVHVVDEVLLRDLHVSGAPSVGDPLPGLVDSTQGPALIQALQLNRVKFGIGLRCQEAETDGQYRLHHPERA